MFDLTKIINYLQRKAKFITYGEERKKLKFIQANEIMDSCKNKMLFNVDNIFNINIS